MKTVLVAAALVATSLTALADHHDSFTQEVASGPGKTRAEVIAELQVAKAAGLVQLSDYETRQADRLRLQSQSSTLTREQVKQEVIALSQKGLVGPPAATPAAPRPHDGVRARAGRRHGAGIAGGGTGKARSPSRRGVSVDLGRCHPQAQNCRLVPLAPSAAAQLG